MPERDIEQEADLSCRGIRGLPVCSVLQEVLAWRHLQILQESQRCNKSRMLLRGTPQSQLIVSRKKHFMQAHSNLSAVTKERRSISGEHQ